MGKADQNKKLKMENLLNTSFELFTSQGINKTSIQDIVNKAGVAKGTFYLYFKDKYDIRNRLIAHKSSQLFMQAYNALQETKIRDFEGRLIFIMDYVLDELEANKGLLAFIYKDLSWAVFKKALTTPMSSEDVDFGEIYRKMVEESGLKFSDAEIMLFMIIELVGSTGYSSIMYNDPVNLKDLKPYLEQTVRSIIKQFKM
ncbi:transcriptional regulator TetR family [Butyrivibrio proteoclasticus B316]|jgi:AcrR family transcriptional regulator|uniref:Transcriptional regulator TetR family n=1 Tax=Butyrivibrio proteoclasticus (strain ATCC 51982 / DSM 14932 / B316) TaxID=515622 RepID=E0RVJ5_BUTPB|nr:TetR/AcrR family transcriptional regulator [Butyrivibrio proteoclasticus]ADL34844.1 transcriptional regulator TetR family [Butyrivibrio proteoclasticus B316]